MLRMARPEAGEVFVDMGSGTGKACIAAGLLYPELAVCRGVEILDGLHREAQASHRLLRMAWWICREEAWMIFSEVLAEFLRRDTDGRVSVFSPRLER